jgi:hypothetical protein
MRENLRVIAQELQLTTSGEERTLYFHGESMRPFLVEGDEVIVEPVEWRRIRLGDIITYRYLDRFPTRRVVRKTSQGLTLWCDNWPWKRFSAVREDVLGRAVARRRDGTWLRSHQREWKRARWSGLYKYVKHAFLLPMNWKAREIAGQLVRAVGLRRSRRTG